LAGARASIGQAGARKKSVRSQCRQWWRQRLLLSKGTSPRQPTSSAPSSTKAVKTVRGMANIESTQNGAKQHCVCSRRAACAELGSCIKRQRLLTPSCICAAPPPLTLASRMATECQILALRGRCLILNADSQFYLRAKRAFAGAMRVHVRRAMSGMSFSSLALA
jgi:hypothetical protein